MKITEKSLVKDILDTYPETLDVFIVNGFKFNSSKDLIDAIGKRIMLKTVLTIKDINIDLFIRDLNERIAKAEEERKYLLEDFNYGDKLDLYGNTICPLRFTLKDKLEEILKEESKENKKDLKCFIGLKELENENYEDKLVREDIGKFPEIILSKEFNNYFSKDFMDKHSDKDNFQGDFYENVSKEALEAGIIDPLNEFIVYGLMAEVFLVDLDRLGDLPVPKTTRDLLNPIYKDNIIVFSKGRDELSNANCLYINKEFGEEGLKKFSHNVKLSLHGAQMSKIAGSKSEDGAAIYMVSWFFAKTCTKKNIKIIWPEDGAMILPMFMLVKRDINENMYKIAEYITSKEFGENCVRSNTPVINGEVDNKLPSGAKFKWIGWDYIRENDIKEITKENEKKFMKYWREYHPNGDIFK